MGNSANQSQVTHQGMPMIEHVDRYGRVRFVKLGPEAQRLFTAHAHENARETGDSGRAISAREWQVLDLLITGLSSKQIARELEISPRTVEIHRARLIRKMGVRNTVSLVRAALAA